MGGADLFLRVVPVAYNNTAAGTSSLGSQTGTEHQVCDIEAIIFMRAPCVMFDVRSIIMNTYIQL